jgi:Spy/CpxP family protein refolding chaperone
MKRYLIAATIFGAMATMAIAQTPAPSAAPAAAPVHARVRRQMMRELALTPEQKQQAKTILQNTRQQAQPLAQQLHQNRQALTAAVQAGDSAKIQQLSNTMGSLEGQVLAIRSAGRAQFFALLTPDQKAKAAAFRQKAHEVLGRKG